MPTRDDHDDPIGYVGTSGADSERAEDIRALRETIDRLTESKYVRPADCRPPDRDRFGNQRLWRANDVARRVRINADIRRCSARLDKLLADAALRPRVVDGGVNHACCDKSLVDNPAPDQPLSAAAAKDYMADREILTGVPE